MNTVIAITEKITMVSSIIFCLSLFVMLVRMKISKLFDLRDYVSSSFSFDLDLKVFKYIRNAYNNNYKPTVLPLINLWSFVTMISGIFILSLLVIVRAVMET